MKSHPCLTSLLLLLPLVQPSCGSCVLWNLSRLNYRCKHNVSVICLVYFGTTYDKNLFLYTGQFIQLCTSFLSPSTDVRVRQTNPSSLWPWPSFPNVEINFWEGLTWQVLQQNNVTSFVKQRHDRASSIFWGGIPVFLPQLFATEVTPRISYRILTLSWRYFWWLMLPYIKAAWYELPKIVAK